MRHVQLLKPTLQDGGGIGLRSYAFDLAVADISSSGSTTASSTACGHRLSSGGSEEIAQSYVLLQGGQLTSQDCSISSVKYEDFPFLLATS